MPRFNHLDLTPDERLRMLAKVLADALLRLGQRRLRGAASQAEKISQDSGASGLASGPKKSVHVQRG